MNALFLFSTPGHYREMLPVVQDWERRGYQVHQLHSPRLPFPECLRALWLARETLRRIQPDVVFCGPFHSCLTFDTALVKVCRQRGILVVCLPFSPYLGERNAVEARFDNLAIGMLAWEELGVEAWFRTLLNCLFPHWVRTRDGRSIFMHHPTAMLIAWLLGMLDPEPWQQPSTRFDLVFVESPFARRMLVDSSYPEAKIRVCGKPTLDSLQDPGIRDFILVNVEPGMEHQYLSAERHWAQFHALMDSLKRTGHAIVLSLHPLCDPANYAFVESEYGYTVSRFRMVDLYPHCRMVVSFPCSTNTLAPLFRKPLIIYDWAGLTRGTRADWFRIPGARIVDTVDAIGEWIHNTEPAPPTLLPHFAACAAIHNAVLAVLGKCESAAAEVVAEYLMP